MGHAMLDRESLGELTADDRARISFGKVGVEASDRFYVEREPDGTIILTPVVSVPKREMLIWQDENLRASLARGLAQATAGDLHSRGSFAEFADDDDA